jgi:photosystem II oxygen-evolving enhancer protein 2
MIKLAILGTGLLFIAESQAGEVEDRSTLEGFLSKSDASKSSMNEYDKFIIATVNRGRHGHGPDALAHHSNPAEHGPAIDDKPALHQIPQDQNSMKFTSNTQDSHSPLTLSAIGAALFSLVTIIGVGISRKFQQATVLVSSSGSGPDMLINTAPALGDNVSDRRTAIQAAAGAVAAAVAMPQLATADDVLEIPPATTKMGGLLEKFADVNRGFRLLKPTTWNEFDGEPGAYDKRWVDIVNPSQSIILSTSSYSGGASIAELAPVDKLGAKLASSRGELKSSRVRRSDSILFYDYSFAGEGFPHELLTMCVHKGRLWQLSAKAPEKEWSKREPLYLNVVGSFVPKL